MNSSIEGNFVVLGKFAFEDGENEPVVKFQINIEQLFKKEDLFACGLIDCSSGINQEYVSRNYATNENLAYYFHETINMNNYALRTMNNGIPNFRRAKFEIHHPEDAIKSQNDQETRTRTITTSHQKRRRPLSAVQGREVRPGSAIMFNQLRNKEIFEEPIPKKKIKQSTIALEEKLSKKTLKDPTLDRDKSEKFLSHKSEKEEEYELEEEEIPNEAADRLKKGTLKKENSDVVTRDNTNNETRGNENSESALNVENQAKDLDSPLQDENEDEDRGLKQIQSETEMEAGHLEDSGDDPHPSNDGQVDEEPQNSPVGIDRKLRGMQIYTKYLPKPIAESKTEESSKTLTLLDRKLRGLQVYLKYLPDPIREETPNLRESSSSDPSKNDDSDAIPNEKRESNSKPPCRPQTIHPLNDFPYSKPLAAKLPFPRPTFSRKMMSNELKAVVSHLLNQPSNQIKPPALNQTPTSKTKNNVRNLFQQSAEISTNIKPSFSQASPVAREKNHGFQSANKPKSEDQKRAQSSARTRPELAIKLSAPLKTNNEPPNRRAARSTPKEDTRVTKSFQGNLPPPNVRPRFTTPLKAKNTSPPSHESAEKSADLSRFLIRPPSRQQEHQNPKVMTSTSFNFDVERMSTTGSNFVQKKLLNERQREDWVQANDLIQLAKKDNFPTFDHHLANFTTQYNKDVKNLMSGFKAEVRRQGLMPLHSGNPKLKNQSSYGTYDLKQFTPASNRSKASYAFPVYSNNHSVMEGSEKENNDNFLIETDTDPPAEESQRIGTESDYEKVAASVRKSTERSRAKSASRSREFANPINYDGSGVKPYE